jgi:hypothetical protein
MELARFESEPKRFSWPEEMRLAYELIERARPQAVGERSFGLFPGEEVIH